MERSSDGTASRKKQGSVTAHRRPNTASASSTPSAPNAAVKQQTEKDREKPKAPAVSGSSKIPMEAKPSRNAASG